MTCNPVNEFGFLIRSSETSLFFSRDESDFLIWSCETSFKPVSYHFPTSFNPVSNQFQPYFNPVSTQFQTSFKPVFCIKMKLVSWSEVVKPVSNQFFASSTPSLPHSSILAATFLPSSFFHFFAIFVFCFFSSVWCFCLTLMPVNNDSLRKQSNKVGKPFHSQPTLNSVWPLLSIFKCLFKVIWISSNVFLTLIEFATFNVSDFTFFIEINSFCRH